jgi:hypothetical protein
MKRPSDPKAPKDGSFSFVDPEFLANYPAIADACGNLFYEDKTPREPSTIKISFGSTSVGVLINDPTARKYAFTNAESMTEALVALDTALKEGTLSWRKTNFK